MSFFFLSPIDLFKVRRLAVFATITLLTVATGSADEFIDIEGRVVDADQNPLANFSVKYAGQVEMEVAATDEQGKFQLRVARNFGLRSLIAANANQSLMGYVSSNDLEEVDGKVTVEIIARPSVVVRGHVMTLDDEAVADAIVNFTADYGDVCDTRTGTDGRFELCTPADAQGYLFALKDEAGFDFLPLEPDEEHKFQFSGSKQVQVEVRDQHDQPISGVDVYPWYFDLSSRSGSSNVSGSRLVRRKTDENGIATFDFIPDNLRQVLTFWASRGPRFYQPERCEVDASISTPRLNLILYEKKQVAGAVTLPDGKPAAGINVIAIGDGDDDHSERKQVTTDREGRFQMWLTPDCGYLVVVDDEQWAARAQRGMVLLHDTPPDEIKIELQKGTEVYGQILSKDGKPMPDKEVRVVELGENNFSIQFDDRHGNKVHGNPRYYRWLTTDEEGKFRARVGPGLFQIVSIDAILDRDGEETSFLEFTVAEEESLEFNFRDNSPSRISIAVNVRDRATSQPIANASIHLLKIDEMGGMDETHIADTEGHIELDLLEGKYLCRIDSPDRQLTGWYQLDPDQRRLNAKLQPPGSISGQISDAFDGEPHAWMYFNYAVRVEDPDSETSSWRFGGITRTDGDGKFLINGLSDGMEVQLYLSNQPLAGSSFTYYTILKEKVTVTSGFTNELGELGYEWNEGARNLAMEQDLNDWLTNSTVATAGFEYTRNDAARRGLHMLVLLSGSEKQQMRKLLLKFLNDRSLNRIANRYRVVPIDTTQSIKASQAETFCRQFDREFKQDDGLQLVAMTVDGRLLEWKSAKELWDAEKNAVDETALAEWLNSRSPRNVDALEIYNQALESAHAENKTLLLFQYDSAKGNAGTVMYFLSRFRQALARDCHFVLIDSASHRKVNEVTEQLRLMADLESTPWVAAIQADGELIGSTNDSDDNYGLPVHDVANIDRFLELLKAAAPSLADSELQTMKQHFMGQLIR